jgi:hypothetical protein
LRFICEVPIDDGAAHLYHYDYTKAFEQAHAFFITTLTGHAAITSEKQRKIKGTRCL